MTAWLRLSQQNLSQTLEIQKLSPGITPFQFGSVPTTLVNTGTTRKILFHKKVPQVKKQIYSLNGKNRTSEKFTVRFNCISSNKIGGTAWESNPPDLARRSQAVLKTVEGTSTPISPIEHCIIMV
ncbi:hypothetical protein BABA_04314 [Neobacillus bataviensis LMG 21833]|uniref:Uncharacterized protein n=1 Tax=Neobacillus bataviensis LMG 21833 TaxID=1117379 RepID=K6EB40_9BACI|nr:hypothetical protein BABA_04314 [Neobacillus bataviensis LMG 21833]